MHSILPLEVAKACARVKLAGQPSLTAVASALQADLFVEQDEHSRRRPHLKRFEAYQRQADHLLLLTGTPTPPAEVDDDDYDYECGICYRSAKLCQCGDWYR